MAENTRPDATQRDANVKTTYIVHVCVVQVASVLTAWRRGGDEGVSQLEGQAENEGDGRIHRGDMHTKKRWIWTNTTLIMGALYVILGWTINMIARLYLLPAYTCLCIISTYIYMVGRYDIYMYMYYIYMSSLLQ